MAYLMSVIECSPTWYLLYMEERCFLFVTGWWERALALVHYNFRCFLFVTGWRERALALVHYNFRNTRSTVTRYQGTNYNEPMSCHLSHTCSSAWIELQQRSLATRCADLGRYGAPLWNEGNILSFGDDLSGELTKKNSNSNLIFTLLLYLHKSLSYTKHVM